MTKKVSESKKLDRLAAALRDVPPTRLVSALVKDRTVTVRVTETDKAEMFETAQACGLTLTEYVLRLHWFAVENLTKKGGAAQKRPKTK